MAKTKIRVAINGFGRVGRAAFKVLLDKSTKYEVVAINDLAPPASLAYLLEYDTVYGIYKHKTSSDARHIIVGKKKFPIYAIASPAKLPWRRIKIDVVLECTGLFVRDGKAAAHLKAGAKRVIISAPVKGSGDIKTFLMGVNHNTCSNQSMISNASCTTNSVAPVVQVMVDNFGVAKGMLTTIHSYTADQKLVDGPHRDPRRGRSAAENIIPTSTGAAIATTKVIPDLSGKFDGMAVRVPTPVVSLSDITFLLSKNTTVKKINDVLIKASKQKKYKNVIGVTDEPLVSSDFIGDPRSSIVDLSLTKVVDGNLAKVVAWYDNEWGYANRLVEMINELKYK